MTQLQLSLKPVPQEISTKLDSLRINRCANEVAQFKQVLANLKLSSESMAKIQQALDEAVGLNYGNTLAASVYPAHLVRVARWIALWIQRPSIKLSEEQKVELLLTCLFHNALEKKVMSTAQLLKKVGHWGAQAVTLLTQDRVQMTDSIFKKNYYAQIQKADAPTKAIKVFDKFDNILGIQAAADKEVRSRYLTEIEEYVSPLLEEIAPELKDYLFEIIGYVRTQEHDLRLNKG